MRREIHGINHLGSVCFLQLFLPSCVSECFGVFGDFPPVGKILFDIRGVGQERLPAQLVLGAIWGGNKDEKYVAVKSDHGMGN